LAKPPVAYGATVKLKEVEGTVPAVPAAVPPGGSSRRRPMETKSDPTIVYLHPDGKYEIKRYALARGPKVKVHDLLMEAIEEWAERRGISGPFRVPSERQKKDTAIR
jgi:hypothetical protein